MCAGNAREYASNPYLPWKLGLIFLAGTNITLLHSTVWGSRGRWGERAPAAAQTEAIASLALLAGAITCGRLVA
ncbi:hypothetical protein I6F26_30920 [Ensifer sp. IC3342]|nr:hypothetical protein [Ensifer sp. BRP08]MCA1450914.1 hypothetical protein [Ensifer sp. IC3342]